MNSGRCLVGLVGWLLFSVLAAASAQDGNRYAYLDHPCDPYYVGTHFPKLITPQWVGEEGVDCVVVLAIDDMRDTARYEAYLRPILDRLKEIDGRAPVSIMTNNVDPADPQLARWLEEGLSIDVHTIDHPCPCLQGGDFDKAKSTYDRCVDLLAEIPGNKPVAFRMPCCDSLNTPSPRFYTEIFNKTSPGGNFLTMDSSVFQIFTPADPELPAEKLYDDNGELRFKKYLPFPSFVNTIENYPYPYLIGRLCWEFPCMVPSDWEAQNLHQPNNPKTVEDWKVALDLTVKKQGVFNMVFHPHNWIRAEQVVEFIDYAQETYGDRVKFLTFPEAQARIDEHLLAGNPVRGPNGEDNGVRLLDINDDGYMDVVVGNTSLRITRTWDPNTNTWIEGIFPGLIVAPTRNSGSPRDCGARFGVTRDGRILVCTVPYSSRTEKVDGYLSVFTNTGREKNSPLRTGGSQRITLEGGEKSISGVDEAFDLTGKLRLRDIDGDGICEMLIQGDDQCAVYRLDSHSSGSGTWDKMSWTLPRLKSEKGHRASARLYNLDGGDNGTRLFDINRDGALDVIVSNEWDYGLFLFESMETGWTNVVDVGWSDDEDAFPMISRGGTNNGAWFHSDHLWVQNEDTNRLADLVDRLSFADMLRRGDEGPAINEGMPQPRSPAETVRSMRIDPRFTVEAVAAEPLIADPVAFDWGFGGELWVVEMGDYPLGVDGKGAPGGRVRVLRDKNYDGRYDSSTIFLEGIPFPTGIKAWRDGVIVSTAPDVFFAADRDGDDRCDERDVLLRGFGEGNQQHRVNGLRWGLDGWLHLANGDSDGSIESVKTGETLNIRGRDLKFNPDTGAMMLTAGRTQFGRNRNDWGDWFGGNNSNPMWQYALEDRYLGRNPHVSMTGLRRDVPEVAGNAPVFPISKTLTRFNDFHTANRITSACGHMIYRGHYLGSDLYGDAFVCEPVHNLVYRQDVTRDGWKYIGRRAEEEQHNEFLSSTDNWFRPVMARNGPDGALWIADMYRLVIEHPEWIPADWQARLDLRTGHDRGRIYRIRRTDEAPQSVRPPQMLSPEELADRMRSAQGTQRDEAHQLLLWHPDPVDAMPVLNLIAYSEHEAARIQAVYAMDQLGWLDEELLLHALKSDSPMIVRHAIRLSESHLHSSEELIPALCALDVTNPIIARQLACTLGMVEDVDATTRLAEILKSHDDDSVIVAAAISSLRADNVVQVADQYFSRSQKLNSEITQALGASLVGYGHVGSIGRLLDRLAFQKAGPADADRLRAAATLLAAIGNEHDVNSDETKALPALQAIAKDLLAADGAPPADQIAAIEFLAQRGRSGEDSSPLILEQIDATRSQAIQLAAVQGLFDQLRAGAVAALVDQWDRMTPSIREAVIDRSLRYGEASERLVEAMVSGKVSARYLTAVRLERLRRYNRDAINEGLERVLAAEIVSSREELVNQWQGVVELDGNAAQGRQVFAKVCANCHQLDGLGTAIGPDLAALTDKSPQALLIALLDPNRAVEDKYVDYLVITRDGRQFSGMLVEETSGGLVLATSEGKQVDIARGDIDVVESSGKSLMPEGLERDIDQQQMAHLIAFVRNNAAPPKSFPNNEPAIVEQADGGDLQLAARQARIYGPSLVFEQRFGNLGFWSSPEDLAVWDIEITQGGTFEVVFDYAVHEDAAGDRFVLSVAGQSLDGVSASTGQWEDYTEMNVGRVELEPGTYELTVRAAGAIKTAMIDLRTVKLVPAKQD